MKTSAEHVELEAMKGTTREDIGDEQTLTFGQIARHPKLIGWLLFWCMCALGWGFDTQVNGAMVSVPAFRKYYGYVYQGKPVIPAHWLSTFNVISPVGQFFGGFMYSYTAGRIGRKKSLSIGVVIVTGGIFGETFSSSRSNFARTVDVEREASTPSYISAFRGTDRIRTLISIGVFACQHLAGIVFVLSLSTYLFELAGLDINGAFELGVGATACGVAGNLCSWFLVNKVGRRPIYLGGMVGCKTLLLLIGILDVVPTSAAKWAPGSLTVVYSFVYFLTIGAMAFVLLAETSSLLLRARTTALATATQAIFGIIMFFCRTLYG
ncbi:hypothetical protein BBP40_003391 [Aspergillus hancockii]|nr:hypothetical protein BBP40_003391 [Aspergillus hancockii]